MRISAAFISCGGAGSRGVGIGDGPIGTDSVAPPGDSRPRWASWPKMRAPWRLTASVRSRNASIPSSSQASTMIRTKPRALVHDCGPGDDQSDAGARALFGDAASRSVTRPISTRPVPIGDCTIRLRISRPAMLPGERDAGMPSRSESRRAAVRDKHRSCEEARVIREEEADRGGDLLGLAEPRLDRVRDGRPSIPRPRPRRRPARSSAS